MKNQMITEVSHVISISGVARIQTPDGVLHELKVGDVLQPGTEVLLADATSFAFELGLPELAQPIDIPADQQPTMPAMGAAADDQTGAAAGDQTTAQINALQQAILAGQDPTQAFEAAAAGVPADAGGAGPGSGNGGFISIDRVGNATIAEAGYDTTALDAAPVLQVEDPVAPTVEEPTDTLAPSVLIDIVDTQLIDGESSNVTFTFSEAVSGFVLSDIVATHGTLSNLSTSDNISWSATFTPEDGYTGGASVSVPAGSYTDLVGNPGSAGSDDTAIDTVAPSVVVDIVDGQLIDGETTPVTFTFSEAVTGFALGDIIATHGTLSNLSTTDNISWSATFTPEEGYTGGASVTVPAGTYTDLVGNPGSAGSDDTAIDTVAPGVVVDIVDTQLIDGESSSVTFTFSEAVTGFALGDIIATHGTLSNLSTTDNINWSATFTPEEGYTGGASVTVPAGTYTDLVGNPGSAGSDDTAIDTVAPGVVVDIVDTQLMDGESSNVTFTFSEAVTGFALGDIVATHGTLSNLSTTDNISWSATFTPEEGYTGGASVTVPAGTYTDLVGNPGSAGSDDTAIDTVAPSVAVDIVDTQLIDGESSNVTFTFSEAVSGFALSDIVATHGTLSNLSTTDNISWSATFTPEEGYTGGASVTVPAGTYTDLVGNLGSAGSDDTAIDTVAPSVVVDIVDTQLMDGESSSVTFTFSEAVTGFALGDIVATHGTLSNLTTTDNISWSATFTPEEGYTGGASVTVPAGTYTDLVGNLGSAGSDDTAIDTVAPSVVVDIVSDLMSDDQTSSVTFTFSEAIENFTLSDLTVTGGSVTNLLDSGDHIHWTATFTPTSGFSGQADVIVNDLSYSDLVGNQGSSGSDSVLLSPINYQDSDTGWLMNYNTKAKSFDMKVKGGQVTIAQGGTIYWDILVNDSNNNATLAFALGKFDSSMTATYEKLYSSDGQMIFRVYVTAITETGLAPDDQFNINVLNASGDSLLLNSDEFVRPHSNYNIDYSDPSTFDTGTAGAGADKDWLSTYSFDGDDVNGGEFSTGTIALQTGVTQHYGASNDIAYGTTGHDELYGDAGNDFIAGRAGNDSLHGGADNDVLVGGYGNDALYGDAGADTLYGNENNDTLIGGLGNDILTGGDGADIFKWTADDINIASGAPFSDTITDFSITEGDKLDLSDVLTGDTTTLSNYLDVQASGSNVVVSVYADGVSGGTADMTIVLEGQSADLTALQTYLLTQNGVIH